MEEHIPLQQQMTQNQETRDKAGSKPQLFKDISSNKYHILSTLLASVGGLLFGYDMGIVSGALLQLKVMFNLDCFQQEVVVSSMLFGAVIASFVGGYLIDKYGRKFSIYLGSGLYLLGAMILMFAWNYGILISGRLILGFAMSVASTAECVYVSEIAPANIRGTLVSFNELGITIGILLSYMANAVFSLDEETGWRWMFGSSGLLAIILGIIMFYMPKSPRFLLTNNKLEEAKHVFAKIRKVSSVSSSAMVEKEWISMQQNDNLTKTQIICGSNSHVKFCIFIGICMVIFQQSTGQPNIIFYASTILVTLGFKNQTIAATCSIGLGVVKVISTIFCLIYVDKFGRRKFLITGCAVMAISLFLISLLILSSDIGIIEECSDNSTYQKPKEASTLNAKSWIILCGIMIFIAGYAFSFGPITWLLLSEIFPTKVRGMAFSLSASFNWIMNLIISLTFLDFAASTGSLGWPFLCSSLVGFLAILFVYFLIPETKGRDLESIEKDIMHIKSNLPCFKNNPHIYALLPSN